MEYSIQKIQKNISKAALACIVGVCFFFIQERDSSANSQGEAIEIFAGGIKYESIETYKEAEREKKESVSKLYETSVEYIQALLKNVQRQSQSSLNFISVIPKIWGADIDQHPALNKTEIVLLPIRPPSSEENNITYDPFLQSYAVISRIGFNTGVNKVIEDFQAEKGQIFPYKLLEKKDLEKVLCQSFTENGYKGPVLLMSNKKKLRIMTLQPQEKDGISNIP